MIVDATVNTKNPHPFQQPLGGYVLQMGVLVRKVLVLLDRSYLRLVFLPSSS